MFFYLANDQADHQGPWAPCWIIPACVSETTACWMNFFSSVQFVERLHKTHIFCLLIHFRFFFFRFFFLLLFLSWFQVEGCSSHYPGSCTTTAAADETSALKSLECQQFLSTLPVVVKSSVLLLRRLGLCFAQVGIHINRVGSKWYRPIHPLLHFVQTRPG